jgi:NAD(P)-dependent dehydrogenase (short-subunit alcohol dehydrogenase family)
MIRDLFSVRERVVVITGGLGQLGGQYSEALLERGARVAVLDLPEDPGSSLDRFGQKEKLLYISADVTDKMSLSTGLKVLKEKWGTPHALINNAALDSPPDASSEENGPFENYPEGSWERVMDVNVKGVFLACQIMGGAMAGVGRGSIVNVSSTYGVVSPDQTLYEYRKEQGNGFFKPVAYSASKSALLNLTRYLATYWAPKGVRVNTITLGGVFNNQDDRFLEGYHARVPLGRMAREDEYNGAIIFLVSDASSYMTGSNLVIDGGWTAW